MKTLFLDLSAPIGLLACIEQDQTVASLEVDQKIGDHEVLLKTKALMEKAGWQMKDLTGIACIVGPGGFTSLRVEVALANALSWGLQIPVAGIHGSDLWLAMTDIKDGIWIQSTKKDLLFIRGVGSFRDRWPEPETIDRSALLDTLAIDPGIMYCGQLTEEHEKEVIGQGAIRTAAKKVDDILPALIKSASFSLTPIVPWYGRGW